MRRNNNHVMFNLIMMVILLGNEELLARYLTFGVVHKGLRPFLAGRLKGKGGG